MVTNDRYTTTTTTMTAITITVRGGNDTRSDRLQSLCWYSFSHSHLRCSPQTFHLLQRWDVGKLLSQPLTMAFLTSCPFWVPSVPSLMTSSHGVSLTSSIVTTTLACVLLPQAPALQGLGKTPDIKSSLGPQRWYHLPHSASVSLLSSSAPTLACPNF